MNVCRGERVRPRLAVLALAGLLLGQTLMPCGLLLSSVRAAELRAKQNLAVAASKPAIPAWARDLEKRAAQQPRSAGARLAGFERAGEKEEGAPIENVDCLDCEVDLQPLDLSDVPTEKALRRAGARDGALYPMRRGDAGELGVKLDRLLKRAGIEGGLKAELPPRDPRFKALSRAKERYERARAINMLFGRAVKAWHGGARAEAVELFGQYMEKYPRSPWSGEAALHLGYAAKKGGRLLDATDVFQEVLEKTSDKPNQKLRQTKRQRRARGGEITEAEREADIDKAVQSASSVEEAIEKLDSAQLGEDDDESFEIHMKAKQQLADIDMVMGHYNDASARLSEIMDEDTDWHRRVWARTQLQRANLLQQEGGLQLSCGPQALGMMLVGLGKDASAEKVKAAVAKNSSGFSMAELQRLAAKNGLKTRGFRADTNQLSTLKLPAILHYDYGLDSGAKGKGSGHFVTLQGVDGKGKAVRVFDPLSKSSQRLSYAQLKRQWSGQVLGVATAGATSVGAALDARAMNAAMGSSTTSDVEHDMGASENNYSVGVGNGTDAPDVQINRSSLNVYARHNLISYQPARGPAVNVAAVYNSDTSSGGSADGGALGYKWKLNYDTSAFYNYIDNPNGSGNSVYSVTINMPDGSNRLYWQRTQNSTVYKGMPGDRNIVESNIFGEYTLVFPDGNRWFYSGTKLRKMIDPRGLSLSFRYAPNANRLLSIVDEEGKVTTFSYYNPTGNNRHFNLKSVTDPFGRTVTFDYNYDLLIKVVDVMGRVFKYGYEFGARDLSSIETPKVNSAQTPWLINRDYDYRSNYYYSTRVTVTNPLGDKEILSYDSWDKLWLHVTPNRYTTLQSASPVWQTQRKYIVNLNGESVSSRVRYSDGTTTAYYYEGAHGLVDQITDRQGQVTRLSYNFAGQLKRVIDPKNIETFTEYAANGFDAERFIQPNPAGTANIIAQSVTYNQYHQPTSVTDVGGTTTYDYDNFGSLLSTTDPQQNVTRNIYDVDGRLSAVENSDAPVSGPFNWVRAASFSYDNVGRVHQVTDNANLTTTYEYNDLDQVTAIVHPDPDPNKRREEILYLNGDVPVRVKDRFGRFSYTEYDALKRPRRSYVQASPNGAAVGTTQTDYDKNSNLTQLTDTNGNVTQWIYDDLDRSTGKRFHDGMTETYVYGLGNDSVANNRGNLIQTTNARGQNTFYNYDENGNQTATNYSGAPNVTMSYNALNDVSAVRDGVGAHVLNYDDYGRLISNDGPFAGDTQTYVYDELQRIETQTLQRGISGGVQRQTYAYDALGRLASLNANGTQGTGLTTYSYDANTERLRILTHPNGTKSDLRYDDIGRLAYVFNGANRNATYNRYQFRYDARDVKTVMQTRTGDASVPIQNTTYLYDTLDQLKQERATGGVAGADYTTNYNYDAMGNRTQVDNTTYPADGPSRLTTTASVPNALNQLTGLTTTRPNGSTYSSGLTYDFTGNLKQALNSNGTSTIYSYDALDRLTGIEQFSAANAPTSKSEFVYDYASRRAISREFSYTNGAWLQTDEKRRVFDGMDVIQERNALNEVTAQLVRDGNIAGILSRTTAAGPAFYGYDGNGNVTLLTDSAGADVGHYRYDAFGNTLEAEGPRAGENPYRFSTKELHASSGLVDYGFRFYSPGMGRWMNRDPLQEEGGINLYGMVGNNPINDVDEYGLSGGCPSCGPTTPKPAPAPKPSTPTTPPAPSPTPAPKPKNPVYTPDERTTNSGRVGNTMTVVSGGTLAERRHVALMVLEIYGTNHAKKNGWSKRGLTINLSRGTRKGYAANSNGYFGTVNLDLIDKDLPIMTAAGYRANPLILMLAHEMGHAHNWAMDIGPGRMYNVNAHENPIRRELGFPDRTRY